MRCIPRMKFDSIVRSPRRGRLDFRIHDVPLCIVNAARRASMADVCSAAFRFDICVPDAEASGITVVSNTTTLHNEMLAHRISFIPIHLSEDDQQLFRVQPDRFKFSIRAKNRGAAGAAITDVTSEHIQVTDSFGGPSPVTAVRDTMFPPDPITGDHVLIVCLRPSPTGDGLGEEVAVDALASFSDGNENCRWCPVSLCTFRNAVDHGLAAAAFSLLRANAVPGDTAVSREQFDTLDAHRCYAKDAHGDPFVFDFSIETTCGLRPEYIFFKALRILSDRVAQLARSIRSVDEVQTADDTMRGPTRGSAALSSMPVRLEALPNEDDFFVLTIADEGHTLGNLVQGLLYTTHVRDEGSRRLAFVGYHVAHPLDQSICMKFKVLPGVVIKDFLIEALFGIAARLNSIARAWVHPSGLDGAGVREVDVFLTDIITDNIPDNIPDTPE